VSYPAQAGILDLTIGGMTGTGCNAGGV